MSELAFDLMGEPIEFPAEAEELRVRRFRNPGMRGSCELVHDRDGAPLYVPIDTGYVEFRALVENVPGRYRLDPVGAGRRAISGATPAYVTLSELRNAAREPSDNESVIRELARANAEMVKTMAEKFAEVMTAAAELLRAADGAGITRRPAPPLEPPQRNGAKDEDDDEEDEEPEDDEEEEEDEVESPDLNAMIAQVMPMLQMWLATKMAPPQQPAPAQTAPTPEPVQPPVAQEPPALTPLARVVPTVASPPPPPPRNGATPAQQLHLLAIYNELDAAERSRAQDLVLGMPPEERAACIEELARVTPAEGVVLVRSLFAIGGSIHPRFLAMVRLLEPRERRAVQLVIQRLTPEQRREWMAEICAMTTDEGVALVRSLVPRKPARETA